VVVVALVALALLEIVSQAMAAMAALVFRHQLLGLRSVEPVVAVAVRTHQKPAQEQAQMVAVMEVLQVPTLEAEPPTQAAVVVVVVVSHQVLAATAVQA
jgi:hypothetical protein